MRCRWPLVALSLVLALLFGPAVASAGFVREPGHASALALLGTGTRIADRDLGIRSASGSESPQAAPAPGFRLGLRCDHVGDSSFLDGPNRYRYVRNNPFKYVDPDGRVALNAVAGAAGAAVGYAVGGWEGAVAGGAIGLSLGAAGGGVALETASTLALSWARSQAQAAGIALSLWLGTRVGEIELARRISRIEEVSAAVRRATCDPNLALPALERAREQLLRQATDPRVDNVIRELYRRNAKIGSGSSMDAFREEGSHAIKLFERRTQLMRLLHDPSLGPVDRSLVRNLLADIQGALTGQ